jgi:hypothetical protein
MILSLTLLATAAFATLQFPAYDTNAYCTTLAQSPSETVSRHAANCVSIEASAKADAEKNFQLEDRRYVKEICLERAELANGSYGVLNFCLDAAKYRSGGEKVVPKTQNQKADR